MLYAKTDIMRDVRIILEQNQTETALIASDANTLELDDVIAQKIIHAARMVLEICPTRLVDNTIYASVSTQGTRLENGFFKHTIAEPEDFLRLAWLRMSEWRVPVRSLVTDDSEEYSRANSQYRGVGGNPERPIAAEVLNADGGNSIECYSTEYPTGDVEWAYIEKPEWTAGSDGADALDFSSRLYYSLLYQVAGLVAITYKDENHAQTMFALSQSHYDTETTKQDKTE